MRLMKKPDREPALDWYPLAKLIYSGLMEAVVEKFEGHLDFWLPYADEKPDSERDWADTFSDTAFRWRVQIYLWKESVVFCWGDERLGGDEYSFDKLDGSFTHTPKDWGTSPQLDESFESWFDNSESIYEKGIILLMNSNPHEVFRPDMDLEEVAWDWVHPLADSE
jgi:hypothetical protein